MAVAAIVAAIVTTVVTIMVPAAASPFAVPAAAAARVASQPQWVPSGAATVSRVMVAADSVPAAGWFHVVGPQLPPGTALIRYSNVDRALQSAVARHGAGTLSFWFRAPGAEGSDVTIRLEALDVTGAVVRDLGTVTLTTGSDLLRLPDGTGSGRRVVLDSEAQQMWLVDESERVVGSFLVSGRRIPTASGADQPGVFRVYSRSATMRYCEEQCGTARHMVRYQRTPVASVGFHGLPLEQGRPVQTVEDLGWPLSHGCTRLADEVARYVFAWAQTGTIVIVVDGAARRAHRDRQVTAGRTIR